MTTKEHELCERLYKELSLRMCDPSDDDPGWKIIVKNTAIELLPIIRAYAEAAVAEEREACAVLAEELFDSAGLAGERIAAAIRARGK